MSDINASIQPESGAQQGAEVPAVLNTEVGAPAMGEPLASATPSAVDSQSSTVAPPSSSETMIEATQPSALPSSGDPQPALIPAGGEALAAQAQFVAAMTPAYVSLGAQASSHPAHGLADQIAEHVASLEGSADSFLARMASEVKKLVAQIKSVL